MAFIALTPREQWEIISKWTTENSGKMSSMQSRQGRKQHCHAGVAEPLQQRKPLYRPKPMSKSERRCKSWCTTSAGDWKKRLCQCNSKEEATAIKIFPSQENLPHLYENKPLILYGHTNSIDEFQLSFLGRYYTKGIHIQHRISLQKSVQGSPSEIKEAWALHSAYELYKQYLKDGLEEHLQHAKDILSPYNLSVSIGF